MASDNLHLQKAKARLEGIPKRAVEQGWETDDPLLNETMTAIAHALIAQAEIGQETMKSLEQIGHQIDMLNAGFSLHRYPIPYADIERYAKDAAYKYAKHYTEEIAARRHGNWFTRMFRFGD